MIERFSPELIEAWVSIAPGAFQISDLSKDRDVQLMLESKLEDLVVEGILDHHGNRRGWYIPRHTELERMDYVGASGNPVDIWMPFDLSDLVDLYESNVVIIAGAPNVGKTGIVLNIIKENEPKGWDIHYFNSEMSASELKIRLSLFEMRTLDMWKFNAYYRHDRFADVIVPGKNSLNIIDFLEVHDEFYVIGKRIKEIADRLEGGIAVICLQKNPGAETGLGGFRSMERARLVLAVDQGKVKVTKAKNFAKPNVNPNGLIKNFSLINGCKIIHKHYWKREIKDD